MYRTSEPPPILAGEDAEWVADELRDRALALTRWVDRACAAFACAVVVAVAFGALRNAVWPAKLLALVAGVAAWAACRALGRWLLRRAVARWVARAARERGIDGADVWHRIWAAFY